MEKPMLILRLFVLWNLFLTPGLAIAQSNDPMAVLRRDVGVWDCDVKFYPDPNGQPVTSKAVESNHMIGEVWVVGDFRGEMAGTTFHGSSQMGYDPKKRKYTGSWIDSASPYPTQMEGSYDASTRALTILGLGRDPTGAEMRMKLVITYRDDDTRSMTMFVGGGSEEWLRVMEVDYRRKTDR
jgi:hypothetical protein